LKEEKAAKEKANKGGKINDDELRRVKQEVQSLQDEIERERQAKSSTEKRLRDLQSEINDLKEMVEEEKSTKDSVNRNNKSVEEEICDLREELDDRSEATSHLEDFKRKKDVELQSSLNITVIECAIKNLGDEIANFETFVHRP